MPKSKRVALAGMMALGMAAVGMAAVGMTASAMAAGAPSPESAAKQASAGEALLEQRCVACHQLATVTARRASAEEWHQIVERMIMNGAQVSEPEVEAIVKYLAATYGPNPSDAPQG